VSRTRGEAIGSSTLPKVLDVRLELCLAFLPETFTAIRKNVACACCNAARDLRTASRERGDPEGRGQLIAEPKRE
jgi:hypothetical protein